MGYCSSQRDRAYCLDDDFSRYVIEYSATANAFSKYPALATARPLFVETETPKDLIRIGRPVERQPERREQRRLARHRLRVQHAHAGGDPSRGLHADGYRLAVQQRPIAGPSFERVADGMPV